MNEGRLNFDEFTEKVKDNILTYLPDRYKDAEVSVREFQKFNSVYTSLQVQIPEQTAVPSINLETHYESYKKGITEMDDVLSTIAEQVQQELQMETDWVMDYNQVKDKIFIRVTDAQENAALLKTVPHKEVDGLAISYHVALEGRHGMEASTPVTYGLLKMYGISEEQLHADALESSPKVLPAHYVSLASLMGGILNMDEDTISPTMDKPQLMVLTNDQAIHGASALFYPGQMETIAQDMGMDYFVLPSSIHEILILPDDGTVEPDLLDFMIQDINLSTVAPEERLANHAYHYDSKDHVLEKASTFIHRMEKKELDAKISASRGSSENTIEGASKSDLRQDEKPLSEKGEGLITEDEKVSDEKNRNMVTADEKAGNEKRQDAVSADEKESRSEKINAEHKGNDRSKAEKKERKSVLARLNDKKDQVKAMPGKNIPDRKREAAI